MVKAGKSKERLDANVAEISATFDRFKARRNGHGDRVAKLSARLATRLHLSDSEKSALSIAARVSGIGELRMGRESGSSSASANAIALADFQRSPVIGEQELHDLHADRMTQLAVRWHRENWDGSGYPDGLREEEIPIISRILRVTDAVVSLSESNPSMTPHDVLDSIKQSAGIDFDPDIVMLLSELEMFEPPKEEVPVLDSVAEVVNEDENQNSGEGASS